MEVGGIKYNIYTLEEVQSPYTITITTSNGIAPCVDNETRPVFFHEPTRQNGWDPILGYPLSYRTLVERNGSKVRTWRWKLKKFLRYWEAVTQMCSVKKGVLRNFAKFTVKHLYQSLLFNKVTGVRLWHRYFPVNFVKFLRPSFFIDHLLWLPLQIYRR